MKFAKLVKMTQEFVSGQDKTARIARMKVKSDGFVLLNDGTKIAIHPRDVGRFAVMETNLATKEQEFKFEN